MQVAEINGQHLHYALTGPKDAPAMVLINSLGTDFRLWDVFVPRLGGAWRLLRYDKRGHGLSSQPEGPTTIARHAADLAGLMEALGLSRAVLFGVSVGGMIAMAQALATPASVRALILADTAARIGDADLWEARIAQVRAEGLAAMAPAILERWFPPSFHAARPAELALWRAMVSRQPPEGYAATSAALRDADLRAACGNLRVPTLVIAGAHDKATPPELVRGLAASIPGAIYAEIAEAGHLPMADAPEALAAIVNPFLTGLAIEGTST